MFDRILRLIDENTFNIIKNTKILLIGVGGVGGYVLEALVRSGFCNITVVDFDIFDETNLNRQILATQETIGAKKVDVAVKRALSINPDCKVKAFNLKLTTDNLFSLNLNDYDYIIDACDTVEVKETIIEYCTKEHITLISCMGTANRFCPEKLKIMTLSETKGDPLARKIRHSLKDNKKAMKALVLCSTEVPVIRGTLGTICSVPMAAGSIIVSKIIELIIKKEEA